MLYVEQILEGASFAGLGTFGQFVYFEFVYKTLGGEEQHGVVHRSSVDVFYEILVACHAAARAHSAAVLGAELAQRRTLDVAEMRYGYNHVVVGIEIFGIEVAGGVVDVGMALVAESVANLHEFLLDEFAAYVVVVQDEFEMGYELLDFAVIVFELVLFELSEVAQAHVHYGLGLHVGKGEAVHETLFGLVGVGRRAYDAYYLVDIL